MEAGFKMDAFGFSIRHPVISMPRNDRFQNTSGSCCVKVVLYTAHPNSCRLHLVEDTYFLIASCVVK